MRRGLAAHAGRQFRHLPGMRQADLIRALECRSLHVLLRRLCAATGILGIAKIMPKLTVDGVGEFEVPQGKRLVLALEDEARIDQLHACGGNARCTTCRVQFLAGEPPRMTMAEKNVLAARGLSGVRLSGQLLCDHDMAVRAIS